MRSSKSYCEDMRNIALKYPLDFGDQERLILDTIKQAQLEAIEACAKLVEGLEDGLGICPYEDIATGIRALKEKL